MTENFEQLCVALIASILGVAYPILLQVISNLDEKYKSQLITDFFKRDFLFKFFKVSLYISIFAIFVWIIGFEPNEFFEKILSILFLENYIGYTAAYLLVFSTITLLVSFFLFTSKVINYYTPYKFLSYLINKHRKNPSFNEYETFNAISDLFYYAIISNNEKMVNTLNDFMFEEFKSIRENAHDVVFPKSYYDLAHNIIVILAQKEFNNLKSVEYRAASGIWLLGEYSKSTISDHTYYRLWENLKTCVFYKKDDYILYYWEQANQYFNYSISSINRIYSNTTFLLENELEIEERRKVRKKFKEFNYALGGLLLYSQRLDCIKRIFEYTQSIPPVYDLLPLDMTEVFSLFNNFIDPSHRNYLEINSLYPFPNTDGINSEKVIKQWICEYIAILFLRQYTIVPYLVSMRPLDFPIFPSNLSERRVWIQHIDIFKQAVSRQLNSKIIVDNLGLRFLTHEYCSINNIDYPIDYFNKLKSKMEESFQTTLYEQELSKRKVNQLKDTTTDIVLRVVEKYEKINNHHNSSSELVCYDFGSVSHILEKNGFAENQEADYLNADSIVAENFISNYCDFISRTFVISKSKSYVLSIEDLIKGVEKLEINPMEIVIISFGIKDTDFKSNNNLNTINFIYFDKYDYNFVGESLFILNKKDLPKFDYKELVHDKIIEFEYEKIIDDYNVYLSILDLNKQDNKRRALQNMKTQEDLKKSVFISVCINLSICWIKNIHMVQIKLATPFNEKGIKNIPNDILKFDIRE